MNRALRGHVTRVGFDLTLGTRHIASLVWLAEILAAEQKAERSMWIAKRGGVWSHHAQGTAGLITRGLILHEYPGDKLPMSAYYKITRAGHHVIGLLREAGIYDDYATQLPDAAPSAFSELS
jgi:hypothetical protein